jgi:hypothetical protein
MAKKKGNSFLDQLMSSLSGVEDSAQSALGGVEALPGEIGSSLSTIPDSLGEIPKSLGGVGSTIAALPGNIASSLATIPGDLATIPGSLGGVLSSLGGVGQSFSNVFGSGSKKKPAPAPAAPAPAPGSQYIQPEQLMAVIQQTSAPMLAQMQTIYDRMNKLGLKDDASALKQVMDYWKGPDMGRRAALSYIQNVPTASRSAAATAGDLPVTPGTTTPPAAPGPTPAQMAAAPKGNPTTAGYGQ